jgi:single-stranded-DNA-specific exonuclease
VVGLVAGRLAQAHNRPALVYTSNPETGLASGSGRSIPGFDLLAALRACDDVFERYGGHHAAAGFALPIERLPELQKRFEAAARIVLDAAPELLMPALTLDCYLRPETITFDFARALERLAPFGQGFRSPVFGMRNLQVVESKAVGVEGAHWKVRLRAEHSDAFPFSAIAWGSGALTHRFPPGSRLEAAAFTLKRDKFNGEWRVELEIQDVCPEEPATATVNGIS